MHLLAPVVHAQTWSLHVVASLVWYQHFGLRVFLVFWFLLFSNYSLLRLSIILLVFDFGGFQFILFGFTFIFFFFFLGVPLQCTRRRV